MNSQALEQQLKNNPHVTRLEMRSGMPVIHIANDAATASVCLYGGQLLSYKPVDETELLFLSDQAYYEEGRSIKGGVPVCWPAFGASSPDPKMPFHGFARNLYWQLVEIKPVSGELTQVVMQLQDDEETRKIWSYAFSLHLVISIGHSLKLELVTHNTDEEPFEITQALHTYFSVANIDGVSVLGFESKDFLDKARSNQGPEERTQQGAIVFENEVDRIYLDGAPEVSLVDSAGERRIEIRSAGNNTMVVWNPWQAISIESSDLVDDAYRQFVCIETTNAAHDVIAVAPGQKYTLSAEYTVIRD